VVLVAGVLISGCSQSPLQSQIQGQHKEFHPKKIFPKELHRMTKHQNEWKIRGLSMTQWPSTPTVEVAVTRPLVKMSKICGTATAFRSDTFPFRMYSSKLYNFLASPKSATFGVKSLARRTFLVAKSPWMT